MNVATQVEDAVTDRPPRRLGNALLALLRCAATTVVLLVRRRVAQPSEHLESDVCFADGTRGRIYRETVLDAAPLKAPAVLLVSFRLRWVHGWAHALFRAESRLNIPLFVGFPGFVSKLWLAHDGNEVYRGVYQWNDPALADAYVRALWWVLALVSERNSIHYVVLPGYFRDEVLADPSVLDAVTANQQTAWWRPTSVENQAVDQPPKMPPPWFVHFFWRAHRALNRLSGGRFLWTPANKRGWGALRITTIGRTSGRERNVIIGYLEDGTNLIALAMNGWDEGDPSWWLNLEAHPNAVVRLKGEPPRRVRGHRATGPERDRLWRRWAAVDEGLDGYAGLRSTETPVVVLEPSGD